LFAFLCLATVTPARGQQVSPAVRTEVRTAIDKGNAEYISAFAKPDAAALASVYAPDGARLGRNGQYSLGHDAIAAEVRGFVERVGPVKVTLETTDVWIVDTLAYETGKWSYTFRAPRDSTKTIGGRYVTVWKKQPNSSWRILADLGVPGTDLR
jgi:uncharacterized protein (TIGR02246 family)